MAEDRISLLPDCILLEIISRLEFSTQEVIRTTSTISKRWQHLWTRLPTLVFVVQDNIHDSTGYYSFIEKTLTQCPTDVNLKKFKFQIKDYSFPGNTARHASQVNSWIRYAITRNVQEVEIKIWERYSNDECSYDDELIFNNSCITSMKISHPLSRCVFNPPNGAVGWDKLKCLCIEYGTLDEHSIGISRSPCLETLELNNCFLARSFLTSFFGNFGVEKLSCKLETYERFCYDLFDDKEFMSIRFCYDLFDDEQLMSIRFSRWEFNPPTGAMCRDKLTFLCIDTGKLSEDSIAQILSRSPCLETLELKSCCGFRRIDVTSKSVKNLVLDGYGDRVAEESDIDTLEINAPYILSLIIRGQMYLQQFLLENMSSLAKADLSYFPSKHFAEKPGRNIDDIEEELLRGLLSRLGHVNEIVLAKNSAFGEWTFLPQVLSRLEARGFQFRKGSDLRGTYPYHYRVFSLTDVSAAAETKTEEKLEEKRESKTHEKVEVTGESDYDMAFSLFD